jgi:hypothetical protein
VPDGVGGDVGRQVMAKRGDEARGRRWPAFASEVASGFGDAAVETDQSREEPHAAEPAPTFGHGPGERGSEADDATNKVGPQNGEPQRDHRAGAVAGDDGGMIQPRSDKAFGDGDGVIVGPVTTRRPRRGAETEQVRKEDLVIDGQSLGDGSPIAVRAGKAVQQSDGWAAAHAPNGQRRPRRWGGNRGAGRRAVTGGEGDGARRGQKDLSDVGDEPWVGPVDHRMSPGPENGTGQ